MKKLVCLACLFAAISMYGCAHEPAVAPVKSAPPQYAIEAPNNSGIITQGQIGSNTIINSPIPSPRVMTPEQMAAAVNELKKAFPGATVRLNYSADNRVDEIEKFYGQVIAVFENSQRWLITPSRIGKSMGFVDGGTLTGEGVRCTPASKAGDIAVLAMKVAGFPCMRDARDWMVSGRDNPPDVVISIGSRFIPQQ